MADTGQAQHMKDRQPNHEAPKPAFYTSEPGDQQKDKRRKESGKEVERRQQGR